MSDSPMCPHCGRSMGWWLDKPIDGERWLCQWCRKESRPAQYDGCAEVSDGN